MLISLYRLRDNATVCAGEDARLVSPAGGLSLGSLNPAARAYLDRLSRTECVADEPALLAQLLFGQWLRITLCEGTRKLLTLRPTSPRRRTFPQQPGRLVLSRFALLRRGNRCLQVESPRAGFVAEVHDVRVLELLNELARPRAAVQLTEWEREVAEELRQCGLVVPEDAEDRFDLLKWRPHELWFHHRSRGGLVDEPSGATFWARGKFDAPSACPAVAGPGLALSTPDLREVEARDPKLTEVLESRRSVRVHGSKPLTSDQLGEFLYRTARTRRVWWHDEAELVDRAYPSGGALHELEIYPVVFGVPGVPDGLHHYDSHRHRLELVSTPAPPVHRLIRRAAAAGQMTGTPQVLLVITARFGRLMWKYQSMAYALTLKNTGVLFASMYYVATAMGLAPCALGGGDSDLFAQASGLDPVAEASVGEFVLGSAPTEEGVVEQ